MFEVRFSLTLLGFSLTLLGSRCHAPFEQSRRKSQASYDRQQCRNNWMAAAVASAEIRAPWGHSASVSCSITSRVLSESGTMARFFYVFALGPALHPIYEHQPRFDNRDELQLEVSSWWMARYILCAEGPMAGRFGPTDETTLRGIMELIETVITLSTAMFMGRVTGLLPRLPTNSYLSADAHHSLPKS